MAPILMAEVLVGMRRFMAVIRHMFPAECIPAPSVGLAMVGMPEPIPSEDSPALEASTAKAFTEEALEASTAAGATDSSREVNKP